MTPPASSNADLLAPDQGRRMRLVTNEAAANRSITAALPAAHYRALAKIAAARNVSNSALLREIVLQWLNAREGAGA